MTKLPLSPREKRARASIIIGFLVLYACLTIMAMYGGPTDEQVYDTPNGGYAK